MININKVREETDGVRKVIHLNNSGASLMPNIVRDSMLHYLDQEAIYGGYEIAEKYGEILDEVYELAARLINCYPDEIAVTESATAAWTKAIQCIPFEKGDKILTSEAEYASNFISYLQLKERKGIEIIVASSDPFGRVSLESLESLIDDKVKLIAITHIPTNGGLINPVEAIGAIAAKHSIFYLIDTCQSVGQLPIDVQALNCTFITATGRKFLRAPRGTGFLYINKKQAGHLYPIDLDLYSANWESETTYTVREDAKRFELFETNKGAKLGLASALRYALDLGMENIWQRIQMLAHYTRQQLSKLENIEILDRGSNNCGIVSFHIKDVNPTELMMQLRDQQINISTSHRSSTLLDMNKRKLTTINRIGVHYYNTKEEIDIFTKAISKLI